MSLILEPEHRLKPYVHTLWYIEHTHEAVYCTLADGCPGLTLQIPPPFRGASGEHSPEIFIYGQTVDQREFQIPARSRTIGIVFRPHALRPLFDLDAYEVRDDCLDLRQVRPVQADELTEHIRQDSDIGAQVHCVQDFLFCQIERRKIYEDWNKMSAALHFLESHKGSASVRELRHTLGSTERTLERQFRQWVGISPALYNRIVRFQSGLNAMRRGSLSLTELAYEVSYSDQSHFIRDFRSFAGAAPRKYFKSFRETVPNFVQRIL